MNIADIRKQLERKKGRQQQIQLDLKQAVASHELIETEIDRSLKAQAIIIAVARSTQEELEYRITEPVSLALAAVYDDPYALDAEFKITGRGTTECHLNFERGGKIINPFDGSGGGPIDIASFALRMGSWSLMIPRSRAVLILDEPFKQIDRHKVRKDSDIVRLNLAGQMLREVTKPPPEGLGLQIIMITHAKELIGAADKVFETRIKNGVSIVEVV